MSNHITRHRNGFPMGLTTISAEEEPRQAVPISVQVQKRAAGTQLEFTSEQETAWLLMDGAVEGRVGELSFAFDRQSLFDESASCFHACADTSISLSFLRDTEFTVYSCSNTRPFAARVFQPEDVANEPRGKGQVNDRCLRYVRTIFDGSDSDPNTELVLGEVITFQGGWSSYPPHHHAQPEIYHYRFTEPQGYGHGELGETVLKVRNFDTVKIVNENDHAQCAAPGYGMYYSWVIRHLPDDRYTVPEFTEEHKWIMNKDAKFWNPDV